MRAQNLRGLEERAWRCVIQVADALPRGVARRFISLWGRFCSISSTGYERTCERLIPGDRSLVRVPPRYWVGAPRIRARRFGVALELDLRDNVQRCLFFAGSYEPATTELIVRSLKPGDIVLDVGAHIGIHSLAAAAVPRVRVVSFEPAADSAQALRGVVQRSDRDIEVVELALGERTGLVELRSSPEWGFYDAGVRSAFNTGPVVAGARVVAFDEWNRSRHLRPTVVKVDVEGLELAVMRGMSELLENSPPKLLVIELKDALLERAGTSREAVVETVVAFGYRAADYVEYNQFFYSERLS